MNFEYFLCCPKFWTLSECKFPRHGLVHGLVGRFEDPWLLGNKRGGNASKSRIFPNFYGVEPPLLLNFNFGDTLNKFHLQTLVSLDQN